MVGATEGEAASTEVGTIEGMSLGNEEGKGVGSSSMMLFLTVGLWVGAAAGAFVLNPHVTGQARSPFTATEIRQVSGALPLANVR